MKASNAVVIVTAARVEIPLNETTAATSVVPEEFLRAMPRGIAAEEPLKLVPGVKIDNQANGERVHISIRGQGLLTEPDPDGNSYQPGPKGEVFISARILLGK